MGCRAFSSVAGLVIWVFAMQTCSIRPASPVKNGILHQSGEVAHLIWLPKPYCAKAHEQEENAWIAATSFAGSYHSSFPQLSSVTSQMEPG